MIFLWSFACCIFNMSFVLIPELAEPNTRPAVCAGLLNPCIARNISVCFWRCDDCLLKSEEFSIIMLFTCFCGFKNLICNINPGLEIATNAVALVKIFFPLLLKYLEKSQICNLFSPLLFRNKRVSSCRFAATFAKINSAIALFLAVNFLSIA